MVVSTLISYKDLKPTEICDKLSKLVNNSDIDKMLVMLEISIAVHGNKMAVGCVEGVRLDSQCSHRIPRSLHSRVIDISLSIQPLSPQR